jgi:hypothetical protein
VWEPRSSHREKFQQNAAPAGKIPKPQEDLPKPQEDLAKSAGRLVRFRIPS